MIQNTNHQHNLCAKQDKLTDKSYKDNKLGAHLGLVRPYQTVDFCDDDFTQHALQGIRWDVLNLFHLRHWHFHCRLEGK